MKELMLTTLGDTARKREQISVQHFREINSRAGIFFLDSARFVGGYIAYSTYFMRPFRQNGRNNVTRGKIINFLLQISALCAEKINGSFKRSASHKRSRFIVPIFQTGNRLYKVGRNLVRRKFRGYVRRWRRIYFSKVGVIKRALRRQTRTAFAANPFLAIRAYPEGKLYQTAMLYAADIKRHIWPPAMRTFREKSHD